MGKVILIYANCSNATAKGDYAFAGNIAKDLVQELAKKQITDIDVVLVSTLNGLSRFISIYGAPVNDRLSIEDTSIGLSYLETFDTVDNTVVAFIEANRCKVASVDIIKPILSPDTKFLFVGNMNQMALTDFFSQFLYLVELEKEQPELYNFFDSRDILIGTAGLGEGRLGIPSISGAKKLPLLSTPEQAMIPTGNYGVMYLAAANPARDYKLIAQFIKLSAQNKYILVGQFTNKSYEIEKAYLNDMTLTTSGSLPAIEYHQLLPNAVMRQTVAQASSLLVLSTGVTSTLEVRRDKKLPYYQDLDNNGEFVATYLIAVKSMLSSSTSLIGGISLKVIELSSLLFANKPLSRVDMERTDTLLKSDSINSILVDTNQVIIDKASGKIAPRLLSFLGEAKKTKNSEQLSRVCASLRKSGEVNNPEHDKALRRAATWGRLFELKVLIQSMSKPDLDKVDPTYSRSALQWAVYSKHFDCARALVKAGVSLNLQDKEGQTALHKAVRQGNRPMIEMLINAGASLYTPDHSCRSPKDYASDKGILLFLNECHSHLKRQPSLSNF